jgi:hypothetical protein
MKKFALLAGLAVSLLLPFAASAAEAVNTLLVVPARQRMVQLAFDMQSLRHAEVISWRAGAGADAPELNYWTGQVWAPLTLAQFRSGEKLARKPQKTIFIGLDTPAVLTEAPLPGIARFETFDTAVLVNNLDAFYAFSDSEWRLLSKRYSFMLRDTNARLRQQNRYAQPPPEEPKSKRNPILFDKSPSPAKVTPAKIARPATVERAKPEAVKAEIIAPADVVTSDAEIKPAAPIAVESKPAAAPEAK